MPGPGTTPWPDQVLAGHRLHQRPPATVAADQRWPGMRGPRSDLRSVRPAPRTPLLAGWQQVEVQRHGGDGLQGQPHRARLRCAVGAHNSTTLAMKTMAAKAMASHRFNDVVFMAEPPAHRGSVAPPHRRGHDMPSASRPAGHGTAARTPQPASHRLQRRHGVRFQEA